MNQIGMSKFDLAEVELDKFFFCCENIQERRFRISLFKIIISRYLEDYKFWSSGLEKGKFVDGDLMNRCITSRIQEYLQDLRDISHRDENQKMMLKTIKELLIILEKNQILLNDYLYFLK